jgi:hypothetical protein
MATVGATSMWGVLVLRLNSRAGVAGIHRAPWPLFDILCGVLTRSLRQPPFLSPKNTKGDRIVAFSKSCCADAIGRLHAKGILPIIDCASGGDSAAAPNGGPSC